MVTYKKVQIEDWKAFYREAGSKDKPAFFAVAQIPQQLP